jgi:CubicO group peptidase (beta-lactamase class C family)
MGAPLRSSPPPGAAAAPGWAAATFDRDGVRRAWTWGHADLAAGPRGRMERTTRLRWFSVTKIATATAVMRLADAGRLDLDAPVSERLPWLDARAAPFSARHLLSHSAGLPDPSPLGWVHPPRASRRSPSALTRALLAREGRLDPLRRALGRRRSEAPGRVGRYTNLGYLVLGELVAAVAGEPFATHLRRRVLAPAGLASTGFDPSGAAVGHEALASPRTPVMAAAFFPRTLRLVRYVRRGWIGLTPFELEGQAYGGLVGSLDDLVRLGRLHLNDGTLDGVRVLEPGSARAMRQPTATGPGGRFGLGFWIRDGGWVGHGGEAGGFRAELALHPARGVGVAVLANSGVARIDRVARALARSIPRSNA